MQMETSRLVLRRFIVSDWAELYEYLSQAIVLKYLPEWSCSEEECRRICEMRAQGDTYWAVCTKSGRLIGHIELHTAAEPEILELGVVFHPEYWGMGYAAEACRRILQYGFEDRNAHKIIASCAAENESSRRLLERLKMTQEAHFRRSLCLRTPKENEAKIWSDELYYGILDEEWNEQKFDL